MEVRPTQPTEAGEIQRLLARVFRSDLSAPFLQPDHLHWKYWARHPDWSGPRSYVAEHQERLAAHAGLCPMRYCLGDRTVTSIIFIDWAADPDVPGAGIYLLSELFGLAETATGVDGTAEAASIIPRLGFRDRGALPIYSLVARPWNAFRAHSPRDWKSPLRLLRDTARWVSAPRPSFQDWSTQPIRCFDEASRTLIERPPERGAVPCRRTPEWLNYMLRCPAASMSAYVLVKGGKPRGYFVLSHVQREARIADLSIEADAGDDWRAAYAAATAAAMNHPEVCWVKAAAPVPVVAEALVSNGYRLHQRLPVWLRDPNNLIRTDSPLRLQLLEGDGAYL